ncbi:MAG: BON domain-containing protein [Proteobacteria bacterium]|nr:BON domain-containing protein [Pseudomonadota bacterium]
MASRSVKPPPPPTLGTHPMMPQKSHLKIQHPAPSAGLRAGSWQGQFFPIKKLGPLPLSGTTRVAPSPQRSQPTPSPPSLYHSITNPLLKPPTPPTMPANKPQKKATTMPQTTKLLALATLVAATSLTACGAPLILGAAAGAGYVGFQQRPTGQIANDVDIKARIKSYLTQTKFEYLTDVGIDVFYNNVLVTGVVPTQADGERVIQTVRNTQGVKKVYNELFIGSAYPVAQKAKDAWIATQIQPKLIGTKGVYPLNYLITVVNNHVYILGSTESATERNHVLHLLRTTNGVAQVHDYLVIVGEDSTDGRPNVVKQNDILDTGQRRPPNPFADDPLRN